MTTKNWNGFTADWSVAADWTPSGAPGVADDVAIAAGTVSFTTHTGLIHTLDVSAGGLLAFIDGSLVVAGAINNSGAIINIDKVAGQGGSNLFGDAALNNSGTINIGNDTLSAPTLVAPITFANFIGATNGTINITGGTTNQAKFEVLGQAAGFGVTGVLQGTVSLKGNALFQFDAGGQIATIADASSLTLNGASAFLADAGGTTSNSALTGLATVNGTLDLENGAQVAPGFDLTNSGVLEVDAANGAGGSTLSVSGELSNNKTIILGNSALSAPTSISTGTLTTVGGGALGSITIIGGSTNQAKLTVADIPDFEGTGASGLIGNVSLSGKALLQFAGTNQINTILSNGSLTLDGGFAFVADAGISLSSNSALTGLNAVLGTLNLNGGAQISTGALKIFATVTSVSAINVDASGVGGSTLTINGQLTNNSAITLGNASQTHPDSISATSLDNTGGTITLTGNATGVNYATVAISGAAGFGTANVLQGNVTLNNESLLAFSSGQITTIDAAASLTLNGPHAFLAYNGSTTSNSALTGLATINGTLDLENVGASSMPNTSGALTNSGVLKVDAVLSRAGGSHWTIGGALTNSGTLTLGNTFAATLGSILTAASIDNSNGSLNVYGGGTGDLSVASALNIAGAAGFGATGHLRGNVALDGDALINFLGGGGITDIDLSGNLTLKGSSAFIRTDASASNSAFAELARIAGVLNLVDVGASSMPTSSGPLTVSGALDMDNSFGGGSQWSIGGVLTNIGSIGIGSGFQGAAELLTAKGLVNSGTIVLRGNLANAANAATLQVNGAASNSSTVKIEANAVLKATGGYTQTAGSTTVVGALNATVILSGGALEIQLPGTISGDIDFAGAATLKLGIVPPNTIRGFAVGDTIDLTNVPFVAGEHLVLQSRTFGVQFFALEDAGGTVVETLQFGAPGFESAYYTNQIFSVADDGAGKAAITLTQAPVAPPAPTLTLNHDTGSFDGITSDPSITYSQPPTGYTQMYRLDNGSYSATQPTIATDGTADGLHTVFVEQLDTVGDVLATSSLTFRLDTKAPVLAVTSAGGLTNNASQTISGTIDAADAGLTITLFDGAAALGTTTTNGGGAWSKTVTLANQGANQITATATDGAGNAGTSAAVGYTLDSVAPTLAITSSAGLTNIAAQTIAGTIDVADAGLTITLFDGATSLGTTTANGSGVWSKTVTLPNQGANAITAKATDAAGNLGASAAKTYTLDTVAPTLAVTSAGGLTNKVAQTISGTIDAADAGLSVSLYGGAVLLGSVTPAAGGAWTANVVLSHVGAYTILAKATDAAGNSATSGSITLTLTPKLGDLNGDGRADIFFRRAADGVAYLFTMNGPTVTNGTTLSTQVGNNWQVKGVGDFDGDGTTDLLWSYSNAANAADTFNGISYLTTQNGPAATAGSGVVQQLGAEWSVQGVGDFTGDGKADVLYRRATDGALYLDVMNGAAINYAASGFTSTQLADPHWQVAGVADFNGDGKADILWRYDNASNAADPLNGALYEWKMNGKTVASQASLSAQPGSDHWTVAGTGDFNGDGKADILLRYENAANAADALNGLTYLDQMNGPTVISSAPTQWQIDNSWAIASIGDYNGDGMSDILFQQASTGNTYIWQMNGANVISGAATSTQAGTGWTVQNGVLIG